MQTQERANSPEPKVKGGVGPKYKLVFLGDQSVGKTAIINRFIFDSFDGRDHPTVGIDFISKTITTGNTSIKLQLWDTAGQERFRSLIPSYIRDSSVAIIVYDVTNEASFLNVTKWVEEVKNIRGPAAMIAIVGNKIDLVENRKVTTETAMAKATSFEALFMEVSAKTGGNVLEFFQNVSNALPGLESNPVLPTSISQANINLQNNANNDETNPGEKAVRKSSCC